MYSPLPYIPFFRGIWKESDHSVREEGQLVVIKVMTIMVTSFSGSQNISQVGRGKHLSSCQYYYLCMIEMCMDEKMFAKE